MLLIIENQSFPCIDYIKSLSISTYVEIEQYESFQKMSFRNRYVICGANGLIHLTIPLDGGREQKKQIKEIRIDNGTGWQRRHWRSILSSYAKSPFFEYFSQEVQTLLFSEEKFLFDLNFKILLWLHKALKISAEIRCTSSFRNNYDDAFDCRNTFLPSNFQNSQSWQPRYSQVFESKLGFQSNVSILDLLFCEGPNAQSLLLSSVK